MLLPTYLFVASLVLFIGCGPPPVGGGSQTVVEVSPSTASIQVGETQQFTATARDSAGKEVLGVTFTWATSNASTATVNESGKATGVAPGQVKITATAEGKTGSATLTIVDTTAPTITSTVVEVSPSTASIQVGETQQFTATARDSAGKEVLGVTFTWATSNASIATVNESGKATGVAPGQAKITATAEGKTGSATLTIVDTTAPTVTSTSPANNATGVPVTSTVTATFSEAMDVATINSTTFTLKAGATLVSGTVSASGNTATFTPAVALSSATTYTATITTGAKDLAGNAIATNFIWSFSTPAKLDVTVLGSGTVSGSGISCPPICTASYALGSNVTLTAAPDTGHIFNGWGAACSGTTTTCTVTMNADKSVTATFSLQPVTISGIARFEKKVVDQTGLTNTIVMTPIRSADVEIFKDGDGTVVATGDTDSNGNFSVEVPETEVATLLRVRVLTRQVNSTLNVRVVDALNETVSPALIAGAVYAVTSGVVIGPQTGALLTATADAATGRKAGAFNIFDAFIRATDFVKAVAPNTVFPPLVFRFKIEVDGVVSFSSVITVQVPEGLASRIRIGDLGSDTNDFDDSVILHEIGHYMQENFSKSSSQGGAHSLGQRLDPRLAFGEGWGNFFAQAVIGNALYIDSMIPFPLTFSVETFNAVTMATTYESEDAVAQVLWDLFDSGALSTDGDTVALGFASIWNNGFVALRQPNERFIYLHSLLDRLKGSGAIITGDIHNNFCGSLNVCEPPFNDRFTPSSPVLFPQFVIGPNQTITCGIFDVCAVNDNTPGAPCSSVRCTFAKASAFYRLELPSAGTLTITLTGVSSLDDLDLFLFEDDQGQKIASSAFIGLGLDESITRLLQAGTYMVEVNGPSTVGPAPYTLTTSFVP